MNIKKLKSKERALYFAGMMHGIDYLISHMKGSTGRSAQLIADSVVKYKIVKMLKEKI